MNEDLKAFLKNIDEKMNQENNPIHQDFSQINDTTAKMIFSAESVLNPLQSKRIRSIEEKMTAFGLDQAKHYLRAALNQPDAEFRDGQFEAIEQVVEHKARTLVVQATGWGKSLVYFMATRFFRNQGKGPTLLISPLLALMRNQMTMAERLGIRAATINSNNTGEWDRVVDHLMDDGIDVLLISPERLANQQFRTQVLSEIADRIGFLVVDEAHCISDWGHDFRPDYRRIVRIIKLLPRNVAVLCTTATANDRVVADITAQIGDQLKIFRGPLARSSLRLQNITLKNQSERMAWLRDHLPGIAGSGIIYTLTIRDCQRIAAFLQEEGIEAYAYWGNLETNQRILLEQKLMDNKIKALVSTTALGMGFDKPDLGFVIHFQRPGSVVHYYQQVGRAGRAIETAYGILLSGSEDKDIIDYFIRSAFPLEGHAKKLLTELEKIDNGLTSMALQARLNLGQNAVNQILKLLDLEDPSPVSKDGYRWYRTPVPYEPDREKVEKITRIRKDEQAEMSEYMENHACLMAFLQKALNDPHVTPCGRCEVCVGKPLISPAFSRKSAERADMFLKRVDIVIEPRKKWIGDALADYGWSGRIYSHLQFEPGRALCQWGNTEWGKRVRQGKQVDNHFDDSLVMDGAMLVKKRWQPDPFPTAVSCVPSLNHPELVPDFARRLARELGLPFVDCLRKIKHTEPQKFMANSFRQAANMNQTFEVIGLPDPTTGALLLVDDIVDSRWTFTVLCALLKDAGAGTVYPFALAMASTTGGY
jgi:ATP-dependent DNA helicase RecQ